MKTELIIQNDSFKNERKTREQKRKKMFKGQFESCPYSFFSITI